MKTKLILFIFFAGFISYNCFSQDKAGASERSYLSDKFQKKDKQDSNEEDVRVNQYGVKVSHYPLKAESQNDILVIENKEKGFKFWLDNRVQMDGAAYFVPKGFTKMAGGVSMRRVRMAVKSRIRNWYGEVDLNFSNGVFELEDAYIGYYGIKGLELQAGNFKEDFSQEETTTSRYNTFIERAMVVSCFAPGRHIGLLANYHPLSWLRASAGVSWQLVDNAETRLNVEEYNKIGKEMGANYTGKLVFMPWAKKEDLGMHIGYNVSYRSPKKVDDNVNGSEADPRGYGGNYFSARNCTGVSRMKYITAEYYGVKYDMLHGFELAGYWKGLRWNSEFIMDYSYIDANSPILNVNTKTKFFYGFYAQASYLLFGGIQRYDTDQSEFTQPKRGKKWGDIELMFRYDYLTLNSQDIHGGSGENYTAGLVFHINNNVKFVANYQFSHNDVYANAKGKAVVGFKSDGTPTNNPMQVSADYPVGHRFHGLQLRMEIDF
ncbi:porin [Bacteroidia bacterium]|nr:porin [Bacteroidia bacterium]